MSDRQRANRTGNGTGKKQRARKQQDAKSASTRAQSQKMEMATATTEDFLTAIDERESVESPPPLRPPPSLPPQPQPEPTGPDEETLDREVDLFLSARQKYMDSVRQLAQHTSRAGLAIDPLNPVGPELDPQLYWRSPWQYDPKRIYSPHHLSLPATTSSLLTPRLQPSFPLYDASAPVLAGNPYLPAYLTSPLYDVQPVSQPLLEQHLYYPYVPAAAAPTPTIYAQTAVGRSFAALPPITTRPSYYYNYSPSSTPAVQTAYVVPSQPFQQLVYSASETRPNTRTEHSLLTTTPFTYISSAPSRNTIDKASRRLDKLNKKLRHHEEAIERGLQYIHHKYGRRLDSGTEHRLSLKSF